jgi:hypothetical protein
MKKQEGATFNGLKNAVLPAYRLKLAFEVICKQAKAYQKYLLIILSLCVRSPLTAFTIP